MSTERSAGNWFAGVEKASNTGLGSAPKTADKAEVGHLFRVVSKKEPIWKATLFSARRPQLPDRKRKAARRERCKLMAFGENGSRQVEGQFVDVLSECGERDARFRRGCEFT